MLFSRALAVAVVAFLPIVALAEPGPMQSACRDDMKALCASVQPGSGRLRDCMREHRAQLSVGCKVAIADRMLEREPRKQHAGSASIISVPGSGE
jgi:Cysteine rich repeat